MFQIAAGQTTANDIINALNNDPTASQYFTAATATGSNGTGLVSTSDTATTSGGAIVEPVPEGSPTSLGDVLNALNAAAPGKLEASIAPDGQSIQLTDLTTGSGTFSITDVNASHAVEGLGLTAAASGGVISGTPLLSGLNSTLLKDLNGGAGISGLGQLNITDRSGATATVDLSQAQTVDDVINDINSAGIGVQASVNAARNGIQLTDTTGSTNSNLIVADADSSQTAEKLGLAVNAAVTSQNSGDLGRQTVSVNTTLASYNGGSGVANGTFTITDTNGRSAKVTVNSSVETVGDLIQAIDNTGLGVQAALNGAGDGISITDTAHGSGTLQVQEGNSTTAADLHILNAATTSSIGGQPTQSINGSTTYNITLSSTDTLQTLVQKINNLDAGVTASESDSGSLVNPYRLTLTSNSTGAASQILYDTSQVGFNLQQTAQGQDALLSTGAVGGGGFVANSSTNTFQNVVPGASITVNAPSTTPVTLSVAASTSDLTTAIQTFVQTYNTLQGTLSSDTAYNTSSNAPGLLQGDGSVLQVQTNLTNLLSGQLFGNGSIQSLADLGVTFNQDGTLSLDTDQLQNELNTDPQAVQQFFTTSGTGLADQVNGLVNQLAGPTNSLLDNDISGINANITSNQAQLAIMNAKLSSDQTRLTAEFDNMEVVVAKLQASQDALSSIQGFATIGGQIAGSTSLSSGSSSSTGGSGSSGNIGSAF